LAIAIGTVVMMFSYFPYAAAFAGSGIDGGLAAIGLTLAPMVLVAVAFVSHNPRAAQTTLVGMGLLLAFGLSVGLLAPALGATAGFGAGAAVALRRPDVPDVMRWRVGAVALTVVYGFILLVTVTPAGVFAGGLLPLMMIGFADEYAMYAAKRTAA
jgi:hypothetical protein